jgi:hypothetical protein
MSSCGDGFLIEPTTRDHPLSHDLYSDLGFKITTANDESDSSETCRGADTATCG